jgi:hypothetical protein
MHPAQREIFLDQLLDTLSPHYNIGGYMRLTGELETGALKQAIAVSLNMFDCFRMRFDQNASDPFIVYETADYAGDGIPELDFSNEPASAEAWVQRQMNIPFQFGKDTVPFGMALLKVSESEYWWFFKFHHLVLDGYGFAVWFHFVASKYRDMAGGRETGSEVHL